MSEFSKAMKNKEGKAYKKSKNKLEVISNDDVRSTLEELCVDKFQNNYKEFKKFRRVLNLKLFFKYDFPLIVILAGNAISFSSPRDVSVVPYYKLEQTMINENKMVKETSDDKYIVLPKGTEVGDDFINVADVKNIIQYQVKNGTRSAIVTVNIDDDGKMQVVNSLVGNFFDRNADVFKDVTPTTLENKYQELVEDIGEFVMNSSSLSGTTIKEIKKILESEKSTVITTVAEYTKMGEMELEQTEDAWLSERAIYELIIFVVTLMIILACNYLFKVGQIGALKLEGDTIEYMGTDFHTVHVSPVETLKYAKNEFVKADDCRRDNIKRLVKENLSNSSQIYFE